MEKNKILEIFGEPILSGGQESFVVNLIYHMNCNNLKIDLLTPYECKNESYKNRLKSKNIDIISLGFPFKQGHFSLKIWIKLNQYFKNNSYQIVHIHSGSTMALMLIALAAKINHIAKIIVHSHSSMEKETLRHRLIKILSYPIMCSCPTDYCACSIEAGHAKFPEKIVRSKLKIIKNGIDIKKFTYDKKIRDDMRKSYHIPDDIFLIGHVGRFSNEKNHLLLLDIFEQVQKIDKNTKLILVGEGPLKNQIINKIDSLNLQNHVIMCGVLPNVNEIMQAMDFFILPSTFEGMPLVGVEAQAAGLPVLVSDKVSRDLRITKLVSFFSLNEPAQKWARKILEYKDYERKDYQKQIKSAGFSIEETVGVIEKIYNINVKEENTI